MNDQSRPSDLSLMKFGIGQPVPRKEDPKLVRGEGRYSDDVRLDGEAYAAAREDQAGREYAGQNCKSTQGHSFVLQVAGFEMERTAVPGVNCP